MRNKRIILPGIAALAIGGAVACGPATSTAPPATPPAPATSAPQVPAPAPAQSAPGMGMSMTASQQQAVTSAQGYLSDGEGFSRNGLLQQLTSQAGEGYSAADATFALNYLHPDWNAQAAIAAKGYMSDGEGFSKASLIQQLTSSYGDGFTQAQAVYGVNAAGL